MTVLLLILVAVFLEVAGQMLYKAGVDRTTPISGSLWQIPNLWNFARQVLGNWLVLSGVGVYIAEVFLWWMVLSKVDVSYAFPLMSLSYILLLLAARVFLHEPVNLQRWLGAITIVVGVVLITRSAPLPH